MREKENGRANAINEIVKGSSEKRRSIKASSSSSSRGAARLLSHSPCIYMCVTCERIERERGKIRTRSMSYGATRNAKGYRAAAIDSRR